MATGQTPRAGSRRSSSGGPNYGKGAIAGVAAYVVGFVITYALKSGDIESEMMDTGAAASASPDTWKIVGWLFYGEHYVEVKSQVSFMGQSQTTTSSMHEAAIWDQFLLIIPPLLLVGAGYYVAKNVSDPTEGLMAGASVAVGYFALAVVGAFATKWSISESGGSISVGPELLTAALIAGIVYPVVFGGIGGYIAAATGGGGRR